MKNDQTNEKVGRERAVWRGREVGRGMEVRKGRELGSSREGEGGGRKGREETLVSAHVSRRT